MGLFKKLKKAFKKVTGFVKKVVKKTVKAVKKIGKKIGSSKILKALAIAAAVVVTGGAALGAMGATASAGGFTGWMVGASNAITGATVAGLNVGAVMKPFAAVGSAIGTGVSAVTGINLATPAASIPGTIPSAAGTGATGTAATGASTLTAPAAITTNPAAAAQASTAASRGALNVTASGLPGASTVTGGATVGTGVAGVPGITVGSAGSGTLASNVTAGMSAAQASTVAGLQSGAITTSQIAAPAQASWFARHPRLTAAGAYVGTTVGTAALTGMTQQYIAGDPEQQGSMAGAAVEGGEYLDPLKVYAAQQGINTDSIYQNMMYGNQDPSTQYGAELFRQQTFGVA
jgi:hypothetical protein